MSWHGLLHFIFGQLGFLALIIASFVYARYFAVNHLRGWAIVSTLTGVLFLSAIFAIMATAGGDGAAWASIALYIAVALGWIWLAAISYYMRSKFAIEEEAG
jgi:hypothetical protein